MSECILKEAEEANDRRLIPKHNRMDLGSGNGAVYIQHSIANNELSIKYPNLSQPLVYHGLMAN